MKSIKLLLALAIVLITSFANAQSNSSLNKLLQSYIELKDALVKTDATTASQEAKELMGALEAVDMHALNQTTHTQWMQVIKDLKEDAEHIHESKDIAHQRDHFTSLSKNIYTIFKSANIGTTIYYQYCPMANKGKGGNWLSFENKIKNPYYGSQMLSCGRVVETIQ